MSPSVSVWAAVLGGALCSCAEPLAEVQLLEFDRVLAARVEPLGESDQAWPHAGESFGVSWLVAGPDGPANVSWQMQVCERDATTLGVPACARGTDATEFVTLTPTARPRIEAKVPDNFDGELLISGHFCASGFLEPGEPRCTGADASLLPFFTEVPLSDATEGNQHPRFERLAFDGQRWPPIPDGQLDCDDLDDTVVPRVNPNGRTHSIRIVLDPSGAEQVASTNEQPALRETLQLNQVADRGKLDRGILFVEPDSNNFRLSAEWVAPNSAPRRQLASFYFILRDLRGGVASRRHAVCLSP